MVVRTKYVQPPPKKKQQQKPCISPYVCKRQVASKCSNSRQWYELCLCAFSQFLDTLHPVLFQCSGQTNAHFLSQDVYSLIPETCGYYVILQREMKVAGEIKIANQPGSSQVEEGGRREGQSDAV